MNIAFIFLKVHKEYPIKTLYLVRHAKSDWKHLALGDIMRRLSKKGLHDLETISSYMALKNINPDAILSSCALRAQLTAEGLAEKIGYQKKISYMDELYLTKPTIVLNVLAAQDESLNSIFLVGHNPTLSELVNQFTQEYFSKFPTLGIMALKLDITSWKDILEVSSAKIEFFIFPKQFKYYMPKSIEATLNL
jgi:phosphohistidine phosphatase